MSELLRMHLDMMEVTFSNGEPVTDEAILYFPALFDSPEIRVNAPRAGLIGARIVDLWNAAANSSISQSAPLGAGSLPSGESDPLVTMDCGGADTANSSGIRNP
jgi:hypothetical protein